MSTGRGKLLLADDSITIQKVVSLTFTDEGLDVISVGDGDRALKHLEEAASLPDIVLADVFMPGVNGYELCARIKGDERCRHIPVILLIGAFEPFDKAEARRAGADDVLTKPFQSIKDLVSRVGSLLGGGSRPERAEEKEFSPPRETETRAKAHAASEGTAQAEDRPAPGPMKIPEPQRHHDPSASFADLMMDDQMIKTTPAEPYGDQIRTPASMAIGADLTPVNGSAQSGAAYEAQAPHAPQAESQTTYNPPAWAGEAETPPPDFSRHAASAALADDMLLDIGELEPPDGAVEADDFILDLADEPPQDFETTTPDAGGWVEAVPSASRPDQAGAFAEAAHGGDAEDSYDARPFDDDAARRDEAAVTSPPIEPTVAPGTDAAAGRSDRGVEGDVARPPREAAAATGGQVSLDQLSPEVIDAIARRVVEHLSAKVIEQVAWEVVPQMAELLIKRRLDEERAKAE